MGLRLKDGFKISPETVWATQRVVRTGDGEVFATWTSNGMVNVLPRNGIPGCACSDAELAHEYLLECGSESPWVGVLTAEEIADAELTAAAEGEGPVAPVAPAPRLCAVDRLEAAGYIMQINHNYRRIDATRKGAVTVFLTNEIGNGRWSAWIDGTLPGLTTNALFVKGDESPGLNAALESLLAKPVGAVTVAQILGVAP